MDAALRAKPPARLDVILARRADVAVVFRRGPSRSIAVLSWNLRTDRLVEGQWLRGRIYTQRCDLSPSGRHLVYFAANFLEDGPYAWTAVSAPPNLTAKVMIPQNHTYFGGGLFVDDRRLWLNGIDEQDLGSHGLAYSKPSETWDATWGNSECLGVYLPRLRRDGWTDVEVRRDVATGEVNRVTLQRSIGSRWFLVKHVHLGSGPPTTGKSFYWSSHALVRGDVGADWKGGEWADVDRRGQLFAARDGRLFRLALNRGGVDERLVVDLNPLTFRAVEPGTPPRPVSSPAGRDVEAKH